MTIVPLNQNMKERFLNILSLPDSIPGRLLSILAQEAASRRWEDVEALQKASWKLTDNSARETINRAVTEAYDVRYGTEALRRDVTGRQISSEADWVPNSSSSESKKLAALAMRLRPIVKTEDNSSVFRGVERGINILLGKDAKHVKVCGGFDDKTQSVFQDVLRRKSYPDIFKAMKTGLITDALLCYENRNLSAEEKKKKVTNIYDIFNRQPETDEQELGLYEDVSEAPAADFDEVVWVAQDSCVPLRKNLLSVG